MTRELAHRIAWSVARDDREYRRLLSAARVFAAATAGARWARDGRHLDDLEAAARRRWRAVYDSARADMS